MIAHCPDLILNIFLKDKIIRHLLRLIAKVMGKFFPILALVLGSAYMFFGRNEFDPESIRNKRVLITGSSSGIGEHLAYEYAKLGAKLVLTARREKLLQNVAQKCVELGAKDVKVVPGDMDSSHDRDTLVKEAEKFLGGLDHLILNHAKLGPQKWLGTPENMTNLHTELNINFISYVDVASKSLEMLQKSKGNIGVVSSIAGKLGMPMSTSYCADKFALQGFFSAWRQELNHKKTGVSITLCVLGPIATEALVKYTKESGSKVDWSQMTEDPADTAVAIMKGVTARAYEIYYGKMAYYLVLLYRFFPSYVERTFSDYILYDLEL